MRGFATATALLTILAACKRSPPPPERTKAAAPKSSLARELGCDEQGRGTWSLYDDGPGCGFSPAVDLDAPLGAGAPVVEHASLMAPAAVTSMGFFATKKPPRQEPGGTGAARLALAVGAAGDAGRLRARAGQPLAVGLSLQNAGETDLLFQKAVDGSFEHMRAPFVDLYAKDLASGRVFRWAPDKTYGRCGNVNPRVVAEDFVTLHPGGRLDDPFGHWARHVRRIAIGAKGGFLLWVVYAACEGPSLGAGLGPDEPIPRGAFEGTIASNGVVVEIE